MAEVYLIHLEDARGRPVIRRESETPELLDVVDRLLAEAYVTYSDDRGWFPQGWRLVIYRDF